MFVAILPQASTQVSTLPLDSFIRLMYKGKGKGKNLQDPDMVEQLDLLQACTAAPDQPCSSQSSNWQEEPQNEPLSSDGSEGVTHIFLPQPPQSSNLPNPMHHPSDWNSVCFLAARKEGQD